MIDKKNKVKLERLIGKKSPYFKSPSKRSSTGKKSKSELNYPENISFNY